jgi:aminoglycoside phosphotransferase (APT) family kinase protein
VGADGADGLALVDFDSCVRGDPIFDVGSFVAYLVYLGHKGKLAEERSALCIRSFCRAYAERAPWGLPPDLLRWYVAAQLVTKHARRSGVRRPKKGDRDARQKKALELAARLLDAADAILLGELEPI